MNDIQDLHQCEQPIIIVISTPHIATASRLISSCVTRPCVDMESISAFDVKPTEHRRYPTLRLQGKCSMVHIALVFGLGESVPQPALPNATQHRQTRGGCVTMRAAIIFASHDCAGVCRDGTLVAHVKNGLPPAWTFYASFLARLQIMQANCHR